MKSILYVGAFLMIGAGIYGFVDYNQTSQKKEFIKMYDSDDEPVVTTIIKKTEPIAVKPEKNITENNPSIKSKNEVRKKTITNDPPVLTDTLLENFLNKETGKEKKVLDYRLFSRAPLTKKYINKELKLDSAKTENKEQ